MHTVTEAPTNREFAAPPSFAARRPLMQRGVIVLIDQAVVSGTNFLSVLLLGSVCVPGELGLYALAFTLLVLVTQVQHSIVSTPLTIFAAGVDDARRRELYGVALSLWSALSIVTSCVLAAASLIVGSIQSESGLAPLLGVLAVTAPFVLLREFARRLEFARLQPTRALALDCFCSLLQLGCIGIAMRMSQLTSISAHALLGMACGVVALVWLWITRREFRISGHHHRTNIARFLTFGRWLVASNMVFIANIYLMQWLLMFMYSATATGLWAACATLVDLSNPFMLGIGNFFGPQAAHTHAQRGPAALRILVGRYVLFVGATMALYAIALSLLANRLLTWLFRPEYSSQGQLIALLALAAFVQSLGMPLGDALSTIRRPQFNLFGGVCSLTMTIGCAMLLLPIYGLAGAAVALLIGNVTNVVIRHLSFWMLSRTSKEALA